MTDKEDPRSARTVTAADGTKWVARWIETPGFDASAWPDLGILDREVDFTDPEGRTLTARVRYAGSTGDKVLRTALKKALAGAESEARREPGGGFQGR